MMRSKALQLLKLTAPLPLVPVILNVRPLCMFEGSSKANNTRNETTMFSIESVLKRQQMAYSKTKDKGKGGKGEAKTHMTEEELAEIIDVDAYKSHLEAIFNSLKEDYVTKLSLRTALGSLESIPVELEGKKYPLHEIAKIIRKSATSVIIHTSEFPQASADIRKAIENAGMGLNPRQDGTTIYVPVPKVTTEHRENLAKNAKALCDKYKEEIRDIQGVYIKKLKSKDGSLSNDTLFNANLKVREMAAAAGAELEMAMKNKQAELLKTSQ